MTGLEMLRSPEVTESKIVDIISSPCPPGSPKRCEDLSCRGCWLLWLTGRAPEKRPPDERTAPDDELTRLKKLIREVDAFVNGKPHGHTSQ